jgi:hypothetical protein
VRNRSGAASDGAASGGAGSGGADCGSARCGLTARAEAGGSTVCGRFGLRANLSFVFDAFVGSSFRAFSGGILWVAFGASSGITPSRSSGNRVENHPTTVSFSSSIEAHPARPRPVHTASKRALPEHRRALNTLVIRHNAWRAIRSYAGKGYLTMRSAEPSAGAGATAAKSRAGW